jgi:hypothetical protein
MHWKNRAVFALYKYKAELGMAALSISFGLWFLNYSERIFLVNPSLTEYLGGALLFVGILRTLGVATGSYFIRKWAANTAVLLWMVFFSVALYISSEFSIILLALLTGALVVRISQKIERRIGGEF